MKKNHLFLTLILLLSLSFTTYAKEPEKIFIHSGITTEGINYQVYGTAFICATAQSNIKVKDLSGTYKTHFAIDKSSKLFYNNTKD